MNLAAWLDHIAAVHPREIELGLDRIRDVAGRMGLDRPAPTVFTVAGTNGKGSTVVAIEAILRGSGLRTGSYLSPHIERFNERFRIDGADCGDGQICAALAAVEAARAGISLSYFEFATLAALQIFARNELDAAILETGLGGRLDAVNIVDADVMLITNIELDHQDWLGDTREAIGAEKAGILRPGKPLVCGEPQPPASIAGRAAGLGAPVFLPGRDYGADRGADCWSWWGRASSGDSTGRAHIDGLEYPLVPVRAMAAALQAVHLSPIPIQCAGVRSAQRETGLPGRQELRRNPANDLPVLLDVAHNPAAAHALAARISQLRGEIGADGKVAVVLAMLADKDIEGFAAALGSRVDVWYIAGIEDSRAMSAAEQLRRMASCLPGAATVIAENVPEAWRLAAGSCAKLTVVTGSFHTVAAVRPLTGAVAEENA